MGDVAFQFLDFLGFLQAIGVHGQSELTIEGGGRFGRSSLLGPGQDGVERALLKANARLPQAAHQARAADLQQVPDRLALPDRVEALGQTRQGRVEMHMDLAAKSVALFHEGAAMAREQLQVPPGSNPLGLAQGETVNGSAVDGEQVCVVGFVAGIGRLAELLGGEGMEQARLEFGRCECPLDDLVIAARTFDDH
jgi:hypothetical protein